MIDPVPTGLENETGVMKQSPNPTPSSEAIYCPATYCELIRRVRTHYERRGFGAILIKMLCEEIDHRCSQAGIRVANGRWQSMERLIDVFEPIEQSPIPGIQHPEPVAILAMSFGYRLDSPFARFPKDRQPGPNNLAIARQLQHCHRIFPNTWIAVQHEIALALIELRELDRPDPFAELVPNVISPARDWTTTEVLCHFINHLRDTALGGSRNIIVASHLHHFGRCSLLLSRAGFESMPPPLEAKAYDEYDAREAQPRFRSAWDYLLNDFLALCRSSEMTSEGAPAVSDLCASIG
jgi:hypothetical protein